MKKNWKSRCLAWVLAGTTVFSGFPAISAYAETTEPAKLADFNFDVGAVDGKYQGGNALGATNGDCQTQVKVSKDKALYLNGTDSFLNITTADGKSILAGKENITVSYDAKPESGSKSWTFFAAPNANTQKYNEEHYMGVLHTKANLKVERYNNSGKRPDNSSFEVAVNEEWTHVDLVISETETKLYVNGTLKQQLGSTFKLSDIIGTQGVLQVGKANWESGEYYRGLIDNYRIYDGILSEEAIQAQYQEFRDTIDSIENMTAIQKDYEALELLNMDDVRGNLPLIREGKYGSKIEWTSSKPEVITDSAEGGLYDGGIVTRPNAGSQPQEVKLTARLTEVDPVSPSQGAQTKTKTFDVTVQPKEANLDTDYTGGYLWANFGINGGYEKIFFGYSEDGLEWKKINKVDGVSQPILKNNAPGSDLGVRDPHLIRSAEGDKYWIIGTDLHAEGGGAGGSGWNELSASQNIVVWESSNLVDWSEPRLVYAGFEHAGCVWAPEAIYDDTTGDYVVYWSARDYTKKDTEENALRVYVCRTRDFNTFSEPQVWLSEDQDSGEEVNIIDTTMVKDNGKFYRLSTSDWNTVIDVSDTLDTEDVLDVRNGEQKSTPKGSWTRLVTRSGSGAAGFDGREGLTVYQLPDERFCVMGDNQGYKAFVTDDLSSGKFTAETANFVDGKFRHGTVVRLSKTEEARVLEAFKDRTTIVPDEPIQEPVLTYDFEQDLGKTQMTDTATGDISKDNGKLYGKAQVVFDEETKSNVLKLDGSEGAYAEIPQGFFDNRNFMSISMDVKSEKDSGNFFTFAYGKDSTKYNFLRVRGTEVRNAITTGSYTAEKDVKASGALTGKWQNVVIVIEGVNMKLYLDGSLVDENKNTEVITAALGTDLLAYLGKSFYQDSYFKGCFDNFKVYNRALTEEEIVAAVVDKVPLLKNTVIGTIPDNPLDLRGTDDHTAVTSVIDREKKEINSYVRRGTNLKAVPVTFSLLTKDAKVTVDGKAFTEGILDLSKDVQLKITFSDKTETYTIKTPKIAGNPVLPGQYADPDIDYFDGKFWIYPTTDGYPGWSGTLFHAFSSVDMVNWVDEGVIMELANENPGKNENGVQIAKSPWAVEGSAWAPTIEKKNGKYYFYYCGKKSGGASAIGVAVADHPAGPYKDIGDPLLTTDMCKAANVEMGQAIDPSIFTDDDGTSYILFGNGKAALAQLNEDMVSIKEGTLKQINGVTDFRESVIVTKVDGKYHWTWSCDDANSPNYHVNYGVSDKLIQDDGKVNVTLKKKNLLSKQEELGILGSAHQSVLHVKDASGKDRYFMAYHRFYTPIGIFTDAFGVHRETCIDEIFFENGEMVITPTLEGVPAVIMLKEDGSVELNPDVTDQGNGKFDLTVPEFTPNPDKPATIVLPDQLADSIKDSQEKEISVNVKVPSSLVVDGNVAVDAVTLPKEVLEAVKAGEKNLVVSINGGSSYQWTFTGKDLASTGLSDVNLMIQQKSADKDAQVKPLIKSDEQAMVLAFAEQGALPGSKVTVDVSAMGWKAGDKVTLCYYNAQKGILEEQNVTCTVDQNGNVSISVAKGGKYVLKKKISVAVKVKSVSLNKTKLTLKPGESFTLKATVLPADATNKGVEWESKKTSVATVKDGKVTAKKAGTADIIVKTKDGGFKATCKVTVKIPVSKVKLNKTKLTLGAKEKFTLKATITPKNATNKTVKWSTGKKSVATVSQKGVVTAKKTGKAVISAKVDGITKKCTITVKKAPKKITLNAKKKTLKKGKKFQIKAKLPKGTASNKITYKTSNKKVAIVSASGKVTAKKKGKATITVTTFNNKKAKIVITVK